MNNYIFLDAWAWLALSNRKDMHHEIAKKWYGEMKASGYKIVTSDYVLDEVITAHSKTLFLVAQSNLLSHYSLQ